MSKSLTKKDASRLTGIDPAHIGRVQMNLESLKRDGVLVRISVTGTSKFKRRTTTAELGWAAGDARLRHLTTGTSYVIEPTLAKAARSLEERMRQNLGRYSFDVTGFHPYRYLPFTSWDKWQEGHNELVGQFDSLVSRIIDQRSRVADEMALRFSQIAIRAWANLMSDHPCPCLYDAPIPDSYPPVRLSSGYEFRSFVDFEAKLVGDALVSIPSADTLRSSLKVSYQVSLIQMGSDYEKELKEQADQRLAIADTRRREFETNAAYRLEQATTHYERSRLAEQLIHERRRLEAETQAELARISAQTRIMEQNIREQLREMTNPYEEMFNELRDQIARHAAGIAESLARNGAVVGPTADRARNLVETFRLLNVSGDMQLETLVNELSGRIEGRDADTGNIAVPPLQETIHAISRLCNTQTAEIRRAARIRTRSASIPAGGVTSIGVPSLDEVMSEFPSADPQPELARQNKIIRRLRSAGKSEQE